MKQVKFLDSKGKFLAKISWNERENKFVINSALPIVIKPKEKAICQNDEFFFNFESLLNNFVHETKQDGLFESLEQSYKEILEFEKTLNNSPEYEENLNEYFFNIDNHNYDSETIEEPID